MTRFYGIDAFNASPAVLASMEANRSAIEAEELLKSGKVADRDIYDVALEAYGDPAIASRIFSRFLQRKMERGEPTNAYR